MHEDLRDLRASLEGSINRAADGLNDRLIRIEDKQDLTNGRMIKLETLTGIHEERWINLDKATRVSRPRPAAEESAGVKGSFPVLFGAGTMAAGVLYGLWQVAKGAWTVLTKTP